MILVTGGLGYIGSHTCVELAGQGNRLMIVNNLSNSKISALDRIRELAAGTEIEFVRADIRDAVALESVFAAGDDHNHYRRDQCRKPAPRGRTERSANVRVAIKSVPIEGTCHKNYHRAGSPDRRSTVVNRLG